MIRRMSRRREGFLYLAVLFAALIVSTIAVAGLSIMYRTSLRAEDGVAMLQAQRLANSAVALGLSRLNGDDDWRTTFNDSIPTTELAFGGGTVQFELRDEDGDLADDPYDPVMLRGIGRYGEAVYVRAVTLEPASAIDALQAAITVADDFVPNEPVYWSTDGIAAFDGDVIPTSSGSVLTASVERTGATTSYNIIGSNTYKLQPRQLPAEGWSEYYQRVGTTIRIRDLPKAGHHYRLHKIVLHSDVNPYGEPNRLGVYVIDCDNEKIEIDACRIQGTILLLNPRRGSRIGRQVWWEPAVDNFPALLSNDDLEIELEDDPLDEAALGVNLNPVGFPYEGIADSDRSDRYPSRIRGLVYIDGRLKIAGSRTSRIDGLVIARQIEERGDLTVTYRHHYSAQPPPGFRIGPTMTIAPGSWRRETL